MALAEKLQQIGQNSKDKIPQESRKLMKQATEELEQSGLADQALQKGDPLPPFVLQDQDGNTVSSQELLQHQSLVLTFYRGVW